MSAPTTFSPITPKKQLALMPLTDEQKTALDTAAKAHANTMVEIGSRGVMVAQNDCLGGKVAAMLTQFSAAGTMFIHAQVHYGPGASRGDGAICNRILANVGEAVALVHRDVAEFSDTKSTVDEEAMMTALEQANFIVDLEITREPCSPFICLHMRRNPHWLDVLVFNNEYVVFTPSVANRGARLNTMIGVKQDNLFKKACNVIAFWRS